MAAPNSVFVLPIKFRHDNSLPVAEFLQIAATQFKKKNFQTQLKILEDNWVKNVGHLRLLVQEGELRSVGLPLRLVVWIEEELAAFDNIDQLVADQDEKGQMVFRYLADFDTNGLFYWIGSQAKKKAWVNPATQGWVKVTTSGLMPDSVPETAIAGRDSVRCVTAAHPNAWFAVDLVDKWLQVTHYTLRHYSSWDTEAIRTWKFEASNDGSNWVELKSHANDASLSTAGGAHTWPIESKEAQQFFRHFRVRMTDVNSNNHLYLALSGMELYGTMTQQAPVGGAVEQKKPEEASVKEFVHQSPFDGNGIIAYLATNGDKQPYSNPHIAGLVAVTASSLMGDSQPAAAVVGNEVVRCVTKAEPNSWFAVDFLGNRVLPTFYCLRHYSSWDTEALRNWRFEGSLDGTSWKVLREHKHDDSLQGKGSTFSWEIPREFQDTPFKCFRILQTGANSNGHHYLALSGFEVYGKLMAAQDVPYVLQGSGTNFVYQSDFDENGIVQWIATEGKTQPWSNPALNGKLSVQASSLMNDSVGSEAVVGKQVVRCVTKNMPNSWFIIDFATRQIKPTHYTLRHYSTWDVEALRNWYFQGSNDGVNWRTLRKHTNDTALNAKGASSTWSLPYVNESYRMFRILQWGPNSNKHHYLALSGFEIYGKLTEIGGHDQKVNPEASLPSWNASVVSPYLQVDNKAVTVTNKGSADKWQLARSSTTWSSGRYRIALKIINDAATTNTWKFIVGLIPNNFPSAGKEWVGAYNSWGYIAGSGGKCHKVARSEPYGDVFGGGDVIGIEMDFDKKTLEFFKNGVSQGIAFRDFAGPVHLAVSLTGTGSVVGIVDPAFVDRPLPVAAGGAQNLWDPNQAARSLIVNTKTGEVTNQGNRDRWQSVRSVISFSEGVAQFSVQILADPPSQNHWRFIVGVVPASWPITWVGNAESWGFIAGTGGKCFNSPQSVPYGDTWGAAGDIITVIMNFDAKTLEFQKNGVSQGIAFRNLVGPVYAAMSLTGAGASARLFLK